MVNVALCFYGQPRYVNNIDVPKSYDHYFNRPDYSVKTFGHCWFSRDAVYTPTSWMQNHSDYVVNSSVIEKLYDHYDFDGLIVEAPKTFRFQDNEIREKYKQLDHHINFTELRENNTLSHLYSIQMVANLVPDNFDFYVFCRYDTVITDIPDLTSADREKVYLPNCGDFSDIVMVLGNRFIEWPRQMYSITQTKHLPVGGFMPEHFKKYSFYDCGFSREDTIDCPMFGNIVRSE